MTLDERADRLRQDARSVGMDLYFELVRHKQEPHAAASERDLLEFIKARYDALGKLLEQYEGRQPAMPMERS
jgi:hypothetical protein